MVVMAMNVELREKPRVFEVWVGENSIGEVISYTDDSDEDGADADLYESFLYKEGEAGENLELGWYASLRKAAMRILEYAHGECKIDQVKTRKV